jgi:TonB family protein
MQDARKIIFIGISVLLHVGVIAALIVAEKHHDGLASLWRGGGAGDGVIVIDLATLNSMDAQNEATGLTAAHPEVSQSVTAARTQNAPITKTKTTAGANRNTAIGNGTGVGTDAGNGKGGGLDTSGASDASILAKIRKKIFSAKTYPQTARDAGASGKVKVSFLINSDGSLAAAAVVSSSGFASLDAAALSTLHRAAPLPFYPQPIVLTLEYRLENEEGLTW